MKKFLFCLTLVLLAVAIVGCGTSTPTPAPQPTPPPVVITVVITATPPPATATPAGPTITPLPTVMPPTLVPITPMVAQPTAAPIAAGTPRPSATRRPPTAPAVSPTPSALPLKYAAATLLEPISERDERKFPSQALVFKWTPVLGLGADECYLLTVRFDAANPGGPSPRQDTFLGGCANQNISTYPRQEMSLTLYQPDRGGPNYSSLLLDTSDIWVNWAITVVKNLGQCVDQYHCKTVPLSPASSPARFILRGS